MSRGDEEGFLTRWSRRKSTAGKEQVVPDPARPAAASEPGDKPPRDAKSDPQAREQAGAEPFDPSTLPSLESIGADTDLSPFFRPGVPSALRHAALRRVWVADPAIRDFVGLQEYDWDFVSGNIPGFGAIGSDVDVRAMAERLLGGGKKVEQAAEPQPDAAVQQDVAPDDDPASRAAPPVATQTESSQQSVLTQRDENIAPQNQDASGTDNVPERGLGTHRARRHGSALPS